MAVAVVLDVGMAGVECVRLPGWAVVAVSVLLTAPRLLKEYLGRPER